ncbi:dabef346-80f0-4719-9629-4cb8fe2fd8e8-CDS [Sclerotinia trifoliorum]|uniref:Dabef346-80f0-4719-9629-4cb8fe2fd8e8-CDS n=1 Tax=Sclerotinia trifoliorum TaxID=28548 RepID=A0A8H2VYU5_9HELO|nr:dabef346-80f0-4719-9629-4cb8fe2fd8e8-CDS [Sclerotinia trifoliorum]
MGQFTETRLSHNPMTLEEDIEETWSEGHIHNKQPAPKESENGNLSGIHPAYSFQSPIKDTTEVAIILAKLQFMATGLVIIYFRLTSQFELLALKFRKISLHSSMDNSLLLESILMNDWYKGQNDNRNIYSWIRDSDGKTMERKGCWVITCKGLSKDEKPDGTMDLKERRNFQEANTSEWDIANSTLFVPSKQTRLLMEMRHGCCPAVSKAFTDPSDFLNCNLYREGSAAESYFHV